MALFQLIYMSSLTTEGLAGVADILQVSVRNNKPKNITGMLLQSDGNILQVLEGEQDVVLETFHRIEADTRHQDIFVLNEEAVAERQFSFWSMGFKQLTSLDLENTPAAAHVFKARKEEISLRVKPSDALAILQSFAKGSMGVK